jgi:hypothetical protein
MASNDISGLIDRAWSQAASRWNDQSASDYHNKYILKMQDLAKQYEHACVQLDDLISSLEQELSSIEQNLGQ